MKLRDIPELLAGCISMQHRSSEESKWINRTNRSYRTYRSYRSYPIDTFYSTEYFTCRDTTAPFSRPRNKSANAPSPSLERQVPVLFIYVAQCRIQLQTLAPDRR